MEHPLQLVKKLFCRAAWELRNFRRPQWRRFYPRTHEKHAIATKLDEAEFALKASNSKLASELGFRLCQCRFPPKPMLWNNRRRAFVCENSK